MNGILHLLHFSNFCQNLENARTQPISENINKAPIALVSTIPKVIEQAIDVQLIKYLDNFIINDSRYGS